LSRTLEQNILYFLEKAEKIAAALWVPPPNLRWLPAAGGSASKPPSSCPTTCYTAQISQWPKNYDL